MKYVVIELQKDESGKISNIITEHDLLREAESKYYAVMSVAAVSNVAKHACSLLTEDGACIRNGVYEHEDGLSIMNNSYENKEASNEG